jgi:hypothetical protein
VLALAHEALPGDRRLVVGLAPLGRRRDRERVQEMRDIVPVGAPGAGALLASTPTTNELQDQIAVLLKASEERRCYLPVS